MPQPEHRDIIAAMRGMGYNVQEVHARVGPFVVWSDDIGNVRIKDIRKPFQGLLGAFYDNHDARGETAVEAAVYRAEQRLKAEQAQQPEVAQS